MLPHPATVVALLVVTTLAAAGGCSVRDEQVVTGGDARWWSAAAAGSGGRDLIGGDSATAAGTSVIDSIDGFEAGSKRATDAGLPMLIVFRAAWCRWSGELVQAVVADPRVMEQSRRFVCVTIDADRHAATCREFEVRAFPTVILLDANRVEQFRATGSAAVADLGSAMHTVLTATPRPGRLAAGTSGSTR